MTADANNERKSVGIVLIGRNEGARLEAAIASLIRHLPHVVYVDSGSTDGSVAMAEANGVRVVELDMTIPFTADRARNEGFSALCMGETQPKYVQFIDGDCVLEAGWIEAGLSKLESDSDLALVTGWRCETAPHASVYNALCDLEWHRPAGDISACGGDMLVRSAAFEKIGGFNPQVIAAEDDELCNRLRKSGWRLHRLPLPMTRHDAAMTRLGQCARRAMRAGHGCAQVGQIHKGYFLRERRRAWMYGAFMPLSMLIFWYFSSWLTLGIALLYPASWLRTARGLEREGCTPRIARQHATLLTLSKFPSLFGMLVYYWRRIRGEAINIIEYK